jgi:ribosomal protein S19
MTRSTWKCKYNVLEKIKLYQQYLPIATYARSSTILPFLFNKKLLIHNGKKFVLIVIQPEMFLHKIGEFAQTRATFQYKSKKKKKKKINIYGTKI